LIALDERGVDTAVYYPTLIPDLGAYEGYDASAPHAAQSAETVVSLPVHPGVSEAEIDRVADAVERSVGG
jgi:dTDP-4-amino-4,6-dideoxygalactose transaminase